MDKFSFGKNWQDFLQSLTPARFEIAKQSLIDWLDLKDKTFLDIGSGSGLFSYAAHELGAKNIMSIDIDPFSVACTKHLWERGGKPAYWRIQESSILHHTTEPADIVYAWGSLHHTGNMWQAIKNAARLVAPDGYFFVALYNRVDGRWGSKFWKNMKKIYNRSPRGIQLLIIFFYEAKLILYYLTRGKNPISVIKNFKAKRGMSWHHDIVDWLGGYPYECATVEEVFAFMKKSFPNFVLENIKTTNGLGNNQFLFKRFQPELSL